MHVFSIEVFGRAILQRALFVPPRSGGNKRALLIMRAFCGSMLKRACEIVRTVLNAKLFFRKGVAFLRNAMQIPRDVEIYFQKQQEEQQKLTRTAQVRKNLRETQHTMYSVLEKLAMRGDDLAAVQDKSEALLASADEVVQATRFNWCCCNWWPDWGCKRRPPLRGGEFKQRKTFAV